MEDNAYNRQISKEILDMNKKYINHLSRVGRGISGGRMCSCNCGGAMSAGAMSAGRKPVRRVKGGVLDESMVDDMEGGGSTSRIVGGAKRGRKSSRKIGGADEEDDELPLPPTPIKLSVAQQKSYESVPRLSLAQQKSYESVPPPVDRNKKPLPRASMSGIVRPTLSASVSKPRTAPKDKSMEGSGILDLLTLPFTLPSKILSAVTGKGGAKAKKTAKSPWIAHVKAFAAKHGMSYRDALRSPQCRASYKK